MGGAARRGDGVGGEGRELPRPRRGAGVPGAAAPPAPPAPRPAGAAVTARRAARAPRAYWPGYSARPAPRPPIGGAAGRRGGTRRGPSVRPRLPGAGVPPPARPAPPQVGPGPASRRSVPPGRGFSAPRGPGTPPLPPGRPLSAPPEAARPRAPSSAPGGPPRGPLFPQRVAGNGSLGAGSGSPGALRRVGCVARRPGAAGVGWGRELGPAGLTPRPRCVAVLGPNWGLGVLPEPGRTTQERGSVVRRNTRRNPLCSSGWDSSAVSPAWKTSNSR